MKFKHIRSGRKPVEPYDPGMMHGSPEKCYPPEGGNIEIENIMLDGDSGMEN